jgi:hypothetical protein
MHCNDAFVKENGNGGKNPFGEAFPIFKKEKK